MPANGDQDDHISMVAYSGFGQRLVSRTTAIELAKMILRDVFGEAELNRQLPLTAIEREERWIVSGSPLRKTGLRTFEDIVEPRALEIHFSQYDCRVLKLTFG